MGMHIAAAERARRQKTMCSIPSFNQQLLITLLLVRSFSHTRESENAVGVHMALTQHSQPARTTTTTTITIATPESSVPCSVPCQCVRKC